MNHQWGMHCLGIALALMFLHVAVIAQNNIDCEKAANLLPDIQKKINKISTTNPELISLHYLLIQDIADDIKKFQEYLGNVLKFTEAEIKAGKTKEEFLKNKSIPGSPEWNGEGANRPLDAAWEELTTGK